MWMPRQMRDHAATLEALGGRIPPEALGDPTVAPLAAVVSLGGCTGSFVSQDGLIATNHHCVQGPLQLHSTPERNLVAEGFLAHTRAEEKSAGPAQRVWVARKISDVTAAVRAGLEAAPDGLARFEEMERRKKQIVADCEKDRRGVRCRVAAFFRDTEFQLVESLEIHDVRLVYAPSRDIGNYGGEIDNWAWPRHTGDFAFLRAYVGPDGQPADHAPDNVPYRPRAVLAIAAEGVAERDLVLVAGYPGTTRRFVTAAELRHAATFSYPRYVEKAKARLALMAELQELGGDTAIKAGVARQGIQNGLEKFAGILAGIEAKGLLAARDRQDAELRAWADAAPDRGLADSLRTLAVAQEASFAAEKRDEALADVAAGSPLMSQAVFLARWVAERPKPDADRKPGFQDRDREQVEGAQRVFARRYDARVDRALLRYALGRALEAGPAEEPWLRELLGVKSGRLDAAALDRELDVWYGATRLAAEDARLAWLDARPEELARSNDPFVAAGVLLAPMVRRIERDHERRAGDLAVLHPAYVQARSRNGGKVAPDANGTLRVTFGTVRGYRPSPGAAPHAPFTRVTQIPAKDTGQEPFRAPRRLLDAIAAKRWGGRQSRALGEVPVNFLSDLDITGGNSGSPVLDARGRLVGLAFDGNFEGLSSDAVFDGASTRTISCDVRYLLWVLREVDGAEELLRELGVR
jgi:hypothetical protein